MSVPPSSSESANKLATRDLAAGWGAAAGGASVPPKPSPPPMALNMLEAVVAGGAGAPEVLGPGIAPPPAAPKHQHNLINKQIWGLGFRV